MATRFQRQLALLVTGEDVSASKTLRGVDRQIQNLNRSAAKAGSHLSRNIERGVLLGATASVGAIGYAINAAMEWESAFAGVAKTIEGDVTAIGEGIREMATEIPVAATELAAIAEAAGALGVEKDDILGFTETVALLGETTDLTTDAAATALGHLKTTIGLTGDEFNTFGNTLVALGNTGASTESDILSMAENVAGAASLIGLSKDQLLGWSSALANTGEEAEAGGSSLQRFFLEAQKGVSKGGKALAAFAKASGKSSKQFVQDWEQDASGALEDLIVHLGTLTESEQLAALEAMGFTDIRIQRALLKLTANTDNLTSSLDNSRDAWAENNAMTIEAEKRFKTTESSIQLLKNNFHEAAIVVGSELLPVVQELAAEGVDWLQGHQAEIAAFAKDLAAGIRDAVTWAKSLDWDAIASAMKSGAGFAQSLVEAFANAPPWLQQFLAVGFVANKFTGGALKDVFSSLASGLIKGVLGLNAGVVSIRAATVAGGGMVGGGKGGMTTVATSGGSKAASFVNGAMKVFMIGAAAGIFAELLGNRLEQADANRAQGAGTEQQATVYVAGANIEDLKNNLKGLRERQAYLTNNLTPEAIAYQLDIDGVKTTTERVIATLQGQITTLEAQAATQRNIANERLEAIRTPVEQAQATATSLLASSERAESIAITKADQVKAQLAAGDTRTELAIGGAKSQSIQDSRSERAAIANAAAAARAAGNQTSSAIKNKRMSVSVYNSTSISIRDLGKQTTYKTKAGLIQS